MHIDLNKKQIRAIAAIIVIGILIGALILLTDRHASTADVHAPGRHAHDEQAERSDDPDAHGNEKAAEQSEVVMNNAQIAAAGITLHAADAAVIRNTLTLPGEIRFNQDLTAHVVPRLAGVVQGLPVALGQKVKKGEVLAVIASTVLSEQRSELLAAQKRRALASHVFTREKQLWQEKISAEQDYLQAQQALQEADIAVQNAQQKLAALGADTGALGHFNQYEIRAPFDGIVVEKHIAPGEALKEDANIFTVSDLTSVWAEIAVTAKNLNAVRVGEQVTVRASAFDSAATGTISYVGALLGEQTRSAQARVTLANPQGSWRPGLIVDVDIATHEAQVPLAVAVDAVQEIDGKAVVFVRSERGFSARAVKTARSDGRFIEIVDGLKAGDSYAATGSFVIKSELGKAGAEHSH
jgi:cobalt-zinc-cadmium efflux system membrane fusion protein